MSVEREDMWQALLRSGETLATDEDYEHGYKRDVPQDLQQYVSFRVSGEIYGLPIHEIEEISKVFGTTHVPRTADFLVGIGNVRGRIMPVVDLARRLRLRPVERGRTARVLIVNLNDEPYGLVVDAVIDVIRIPPEKIEEKPGGSNCDLAHPEGCPGGLAKNYQIATLGQELKDKLESAARDNPDLSALKDAVTIELTRDGLRIEMTDSEKSTFFQVGGARPTKAAVAILQQIAQEISKLPNPIELEGHTDRRPYPSGSYTNWDLSAERANAARRILELSGVSSISQVSGLADTRLRNQGDPYDLSNRRVSILVRQ